MIVKTAAALPRQETVIFEAVMIESSWHYGTHRSAGKALKKRREGLPAEVIEIARSAIGDCIRSSGVWSIEGKTDRKTAVAVSRELAGFIWAIGQVA